MLEYIKTKRLSEEINQKLKELMPYIYSQTNKNMREIIDEYFNLGMIDGLEKKQIELKIILNRICYEIEKELFDIYGAEFISSVYFYDDFENRLYLGASPNGNPGWNNAVESLTLIPGPNVASCGTALYLGEPVIVSDTYTDDRWIDFREIAMKYEIKTSWSVPFFYQHKPIGTFDLTANTNIVPSEKVVNLMINKSKELQEKMMVIQDDLMRIRHQMYKIEGIVDLNGYIEMVISDFSLKLEGQLRKELIHPADRIQATKMWKRVLDGETVRFFHRVKNLFPELECDNEWVTVEVSWHPVIDDDGEVIASRSVVLFNTKECKVKDEFRDKYLKFTAITDSSGHLITYGSRGIKDVLGINPTAWMGVKKYVNIHPEDHERAYNTMYKAKNEKKVTTSVHRFIRHDGQSITLELHFSPLIDHDGNVTNIYTEIYQGTPSCQEYDWLMEHKTNSQ